MLKMTKHTLKIFRCETLKFLKLFGHFSTLYLKELSDQIVLTIKITPVQSYTQFLIFLDIYLHAQNQHDLPITSSDITDQRILQHDWLRIILMPSAIKKKLLMMMNRFAE